MSKYVRMLPYRPKAGFTTQRHCHDGTVYLGGPKPIWYLVSDALASVLLAKRQDPQNPHSLPLFEAKTEAEKKQLDVKEQTEALVRAGLVSATAPGSVVDVAPVRDMRTAEERAADEAVHTIPAAVPPSAGAGRAAAIPKGPVQRSAAKAAYETEDLGDGYTPPEEELEEFAPEELEEPAPAAMPKPARMPAAPSEGGALTTGALPGVRGASKRRAPRG